MGRAVRPQVHHARRRVVCSGQGPANHGGIARLAKEARAIRLAHVTATPLKVFLLLPVFGKRPKLVRKGTAAALAESAAAALSEHETARRVDLEMAPAAFDKALELDPLADGHAKGAAAGDPLREGMIYLSTADAARVGEPGLSRGFSPAQGFGISPGGYEWAGFWHEKHTYLRGTPGHGWSENVYLPTLYHFLFQLSSGIFSLACNDQCARL